MIEILITWIGVEEWIGFKVFHYLTIKGCNLSHNWLIISTWIWRNISLNSIINYSFLLLPNHFWIYLFSFSNNNYLIPHWIPNKIPVYLWFLIEWIGAEGLDERGIPRYIVQRFHCALHQLNGISLNNETWGNFSFKFNQYHCDVFFSLNFIQA